MLIDSHCHLDFEDFDHDRQTVLNDARTAGVSTIVVPGVAQATWARTVKVSQNAELPFALGLHPMFIDEHQPQHLHALDSAITTHKPIAVGEIGLDFYDKNVNHEKQSAYFSKQLIIAKQHDLPVIIHCRKAHDQCINMLAEHRPAGGIIHAFNGSIQQAHKYIELGFLLGFGGMLTYQRSNKLRKLAFEIPLSAIALETDAPDMTVEQHRGLRNSPAYLPLIAQALADLKLASVEEIAEVTSKNVCAALRLRQTPADDRC